MYTVSTRAPLDRDRVVRTAVAFADGHGLDALTMRRLSGELGVVPMALYKHVSDKDDLVNGMIDAVVASYPSPRAQGWKARVRERVLGARDRTLAHPWLRSAIESRGAPTPTVLEYQNALAGELIAGGLSVDLAHHALHALGHRIWGFSPEAFRGAPAAAPDPARAAELTARVPHVVAIAVDAGLRSGTGACDDDAEFEFTLDLLLDAFERLHDSGWESPRRVSV
jgi:AcrR family transcriptional regulator